MVGSEGDTEKLRAEQVSRELEESRRAQDAQSEEDSAQHGRRAEKARYLREKLEERAESEREVAEEGGSDPESAG